MHYHSIFKTPYCYNFSIGYAIAQRLGQEGASVIISSRKENNVENAVKNLRSEGITVEGVVCHVGNADQRKKLFDIVSTEYTT